MGIQREPILFQRLLARLMGLRPEPRMDLVPQTPAKYTRADMDASLKAIVVPHLREAGFAGSLPRFRRERDGALDALSVSFDKYGGRFAIWLARFPAEGQTYDGRFITPEQADPMYQKDSLGLGMHESWRKDGWYDFRQRHPDHVAREVVEDLERPETWAKVDRLGLDAQM